MANRIKLKRSSVSGNLPGTTDIEVGEVALNMADQVIHYRDASDNIKGVVHDSASNLETEGNFTMDTAGSFDIKNATAFNVTAEHHSGFGIGSLPNLTRKRRGNLGTLKSALSFKLEETDSSGVMIDATSGAGADMAYFVNDGEIGNVAIRAKTAASNVDNTLDVANSESEFVVLLRAPTTEAVFSVNHEAAQMFDSDILFESDGIKQTITATGDLLLAGSSTGKVYTETPVEITSDSQTQGIPLTVTADVQSLSGSAAHNAKNLLLLKEDTNNTRRTRLSMGTSQSGTPHHHATIETRYDDTVQSWRVTADDFTTGDEVVEMIKMDYDPVTFDQTMTLSGTVTANDRLITNSGMLNNATGYGSALFASRNSGGDSLIIQQTSTDDLVDLVGFDGANIGWEMAAADGTAYPGYMTMGYHPTNGNYYSLNAYNDGVSTYGVDNIMFADSNHLDIMKAELTFASDGTDQTITPTGTLTVENNALIADAGMSVNGGFTNHATGYSSAAVLSTNVGGAGLIIKRTSTDNLADMSGNDVGQVAFELAAADGTAYPAYFTSGYDSTSSGNYLSFFAYDDGVSTFNTVNMLQAKQNSFSVCNYKLHISSDTTTQVIEGVNELMLRAEDEDMVIMSETLVDFRQVVELAKFSSDPTGVTGGMYYNTTSNKFRVYDGTSWVSIVTS